ncbi:hypothetical protein COV49_00540 [Candidatus Falkowbacteria bacterium CG11_big_fil_rev_8_21_14_0_20_39_10]|uniref:Uncharacterized protein n=1 Tax=Candidatus Falkowbacteria bacterium CG11_big_fil_rev_8_21_14_0_20_39_10 TaxID=1974570 RepID=A0A2M6KA52_9BACT|nr:MAG: hypothetical protein COV49_00540 [Candidatus Falkowbacteria bacterium CG11_big_fil_rev_8_21_14_0_20_39_10]
MTAAVLQIPKPKGWDERVLYDYTHWGVVGKCRWCCRTVTRDGTIIHHSFYQMKAGVFAKLPFILCVDKHCRQRDERHKKIWEGFQKIEPLNKE